MSDPTPDPTPEPDPAPEPDPTPEPEPEPDEVAKAVAEATKKANAEAAKFRKQRDEWKAKAEEASKGKVDESAVEKAAREAAEKAAAEYQAKLDAKAREAELFRDHGAKFRRPDDALKFIDLDALDDDTTLDEAVDTLLEERPYLAVDETRPSGSGDAGSRTPPKVKDPGEMSVPEYQEWRQKQIEAGTWGRP